MDSVDFDRQWQGQSTAILTGMEEWRFQHPQATLDEIEAAVDDRWRGGRRRPLGPLTSRSRRRKWHDWNRTCRLRQLDQRNKCWK